MNWTTRKANTLIKRLQNIHQYSARGVINKIRLANYFNDNNDLYSLNIFSLTSSSSVEPRLICIHSGRAIIRSFDIAVFSQSNQMIGDGVSSFFRGYDDVYDDLKSHPHYQRSIFSKTFEWIEQPLPFTNSIFLLYSPWSHNNYYHFMIDLLPRAKFAQEVSYHERNLSTLLTFSPNSYQREALNRVGIENLNILQELTLHLQAPKIYCIAQT